MMLEEEVELNNKRAKYNAYYHKRKQNKKWVAHKNALARLNYYKRKLKNSKLNKQTDNTADNKPVSNYPVINKDYRIIKNINGFGDLRYRIQIRKSFLGIKYWKYIIDYCGYPMEYFTKDEAMRIVEAYLGD
ncbi:MAG: hypothetical protein MJ244_05110 [Clostridia bacterium]|nr:hypothetical protein [Clostridia bacterium]